MVKRAGKEVILVEIFKENYEILKNRAYAKRYTVKDYVNLLLAMNLEKDNLLQKYAPNLSVYDYQDNRLILMDTKIKGLVDVYLKDNTLYCESHKSTDCIHTRYAWAVPEIGKLLTMHSTTTTTTKENSKKKLEIIV